jgi:hypothetical protein
MEQFFVPKAEDAMGVSREIQFVVGDVICRAKGWNELPEMMIPLACSEIFDSKMVVAAAFEALRIGVSADFAAVAMLCIHCVTWIGRYESKGFLRKLLESKFERESRRLAYKIWYEIKPLVENRIEECDYFMELTLDNLDRQSNS